MRRSNQPQDRFSRPGPRKTTNEIDINAYYDKSWAVVVGINDYGDQHDRLYNARSDAEALTRILKEYGFDPIFTLYDCKATKGHIMTQLLDDLPGKTSLNDRLVFFFAGHGDSQPGKSRPYGYLIPYGARRKAYSDYISMRELADACEIIPAKHILLLLDCCFSGIAALTTRSASSPPIFMDDAFLKEVTSRKAYQVITAGDADETVLDSGIRAGHSAFTSALLAGLEGEADQNKDCLITANELFDYLRPEVIRDTTRHGKKGQSPCRAELPGSEQGDFVFKVPEQGLNVVPLNQPTFGIERLSTRQVRLWAATMGALIVTFALLWFAWKIAPLVAEWLPKSTAVASELLVPGTMPARVVMPAKPTHTPSPLETASLITTTITPDLATPIVDVISPTPQAEPSTPTPTQATPTQIPTSPPPPPTAGPRSLQFKSDIFGQLGPNQEQWYTFVDRSGDTIIFFAFSPNVNLNGEQMQVYVYHQNQIPGWPPREPDKLAHLGMGEPPSSDRDGDGGTGELIWRGSVFKDTRYYIRSINRSGSWIRYCITFKDLFNESCLR